RCRGFSPATRSRPGWRTPHPPHPVWPVSDVVCLAISRPGPVRSRDTRPTGVDVCGGPPPPPDRTRTRTTHRDSPELGLSVSLVFLGVGVVPCAVPGSGCAGHATEQRLSHPPCRVRR